MKYPPDVFCLIECICLTQREDANDDAAVAGTSAGDAKERSKKKQEAAPERLSEVPACLRRVGEWGPWVGVSDSLGPIQNDLSDEP